MRDLERKGFQNGLLEPTSYENNPIGSMMTKTCWARATSAVPILGNDGKPTEDLDLVRLSSGVTKDSQPINEPIAFINKTKPTSKKGTAYTIDSTEIFKGTSGITAINITQKSHQINNCQINFLVPNPNEFEDIQNAFMKFGRMIMVEFGWSTPETNSYENKKPTLDSILSVSKNLQDRNEKGNGKYQGVIGVVTNFTYDIRNDGAYECTTTITSMGRNIFGTGLHKDNLDGVIAVASGNDEDTDTPEHKKLRRHLVNFEASIKHLDKVVDKYLERKFTPKEIKKQKTILYYNGVAKYMTDDGYFIDTHQRYVSWGWFEDHILSNFFSFVSSDAKSFKTHIRSVSTIKDELGNWVDNIKNECQSNKNLYSMGLESIVLPGKTKLAVNKVTKKKVKVINNRYGVVTGEKEVETNTLDKDDIISQNLIESVSNAFPAFESVPNKRGYIRHMVFNIKLLQKYFSNITDFESGMDTFWNMVSSEYGGFWDFVIVNDDVDQGRVGVVDSSILAIPVNSIPELTGENRSNIVSSEGDYLNWKPKTPDPQKIFMMPLYSKGSFIKDFSFNVSYTAQMATQALYGSHSSVNDSAGFAHQGPLNMGVRALSILQNSFSGITTKKGGTKQTDEILKDIKYASIFGTSSTLTETGNTANPLQLKEGVRFDLIEEITKTVEDYEIALEKKISKNKQNLKKQANKDNAILDVNDVPIENTYWPDGDSNVPLYNKGGHMYKGYQRGMLYKLNTSLGKDDDSVAKRVNVPLPAKLSITMDGVGGLKIGNLFVVDYLPKEYRNFCHFMITKVDHDMSMNGWTTKIDAIVRLNMRALIEAKKKTDKEVAPEEVKPIETDSNPLDKTTEDTKKEQKLPETPMIEKEVTEQEQDLIDEQFLLNLQDMVETTEPTTSFVAITEDSQVNLDLLVQAKKAETKIATLKVDAPPYEQPPAVKTIPPYPFAKENFNKPNASAWREYQAKNMGYNSWKKCTANESLKKRQRHWDGFLSMGVEMWTKDPPPND